MEGKKTIADGCCSVAVKMGKHVILNMAVNRRKEFYVVVGCLYVKKRRRNNNNKK